MVLKLLLFLLCVLETLQHLSYPINFCNMASTCIHDSRVVCASSPDGCTRRSFLDQCDMYEYNCDYGTQYMTKVTSSCTSGYQETYILFCGTLLTSTQITQISSNITEDTTDTEISISSTKELTLSTSTSIITTANNNSNENNTNKSDSDTTVNPTTYVYCCDRPLTWETTTEVTKIYDMTTDNHSDETKQTTEASTEYNVTDSVNDTTTNIHDNTITFTTTNQQISHTGDTTTIVNTETDKKESTIEIINQTTSTYCCDRPLTWETTTEVTKIYEDNTINHNSDENKQTTEASTEYNATDSVYDETTNIYNNNVTFTSTNQQISHTVDTTTIVNTETDKKESSIEIINQTTPTYCCDRPLTWKMTTEVPKIYEDNTINHNSDENKQTTEASTEYNATDSVYDETTNIYNNNVTFTTINQQISDTVTIDDTTIVVNTETKEAPDKKPSDMDVNQTTTEYCCNRPFTWDTTEITKKIEDITNDTNHSEEEKLLTATINDNTEDTSTYSTTPTTQKIEEIYSKTLVSLTGKVSKKCPNKCQRPVTWLTTRRGRKHYWN